MSLSNCIIVGLVLVLVFREVPGDSMSAFAIGGIVGLVLGGVIGVSFTYGERGREPS